MQACYPTTKWIRAAAATFEPVTLAELKWQCEEPQSLTYHDGYLKDLMYTAWAMVERDTSIVLCSGSYSRKYTDFPRTAWMELADLWPINSITSITYTDISGTQTWGASSYSLDPSTPPSVPYVPRILLAYNELWPVTRGEVNDVTVTVAAGYASQALVPHMAKSAIKLLVKHWFDNRSAVDTTAMKEVPMAYESLVGCLRREVYA